MCDDAYSHFMWSVTNLFNETDCDVYANSMYNIDDIYEMITSGLNFDMDDNLNNPYWYEMSNKLKNTLNNINEVYKRAIKLIDTDFIKEKESSTMSDEEIEQSLADKYIEKFVMYFFTEINDNITIRIFHS